MEQGTDWITPQKLTQKKEILALVVSTFFIRSTIKNKKDLYYVIHYFSLDLAKQENSGQWHRHLILVIRKTNKIIVVHLPLCKVGLIFYK